jgi:hypothetical protein
MRNACAHRRVAAVIALSVLILGTAPASATTPHPILPPHNPAKNFRLASVSRVLASINAARASEEGLGPLRFNSTRFAHLSVSEQVFVVTNMERATRGLTPATAMVTRLDTIATNAARHDEDPVDHGVSFSSIWSSAPGSFGQPAFFADFGWMYDDGPPPQYIFRNVDCAHAGQSGCWGHRDNILSDPLANAPSSGCPLVLVTGTGYDARSADGPSLTQIFEVACSHLGASAVFTWRYAVTYLQIPATQSGLTA